MSIRGSQTKYAWRSCAVGAKAERWAPLLADIRLSWFSSLSLPLSLYCSLQSGSLGAHQTREKSALATALSKSYSWALFAFAPRTEGSNLSPARKNTGASRKWWWLRFPQSWRRLSCHQYLALEILLQPSHAFSSKSPSSRAQLLRRLS